MDRSTTGLRLKAEAAINLHMHTTWSDGRWTAEALFDHLRQEQFDLAAITDHDRPDTAPLIQQLAAEKGLPMLVAAEMSTRWKGKLTDLLCYGFEIRHTALHELAAGLLLRQRENTREVYENLLRQGVLPDCEALPGLLALPQPEQPRALVGLVKTRQGEQAQPNAWEVVLRAGCEFVKSEAPAIVQAAQRSGALCLLAHPGRGNGFSTFDAQALDEFRQEAPIDGLEAHYPLHSPAQTALYLEYARRHGLVTSAGSDSHGPEKPPLKYPAALSRDLLERLGIRVEA